MISALSPLDLDEVLRYMGCPAEKADPETRTLVKTCAREMEAAARPRWTGRVLDITLEEDGVRLEGGLLLPGRDLRKHLEGCERAAVFCATLSAQADALIRRWESRDMLRALALDCCATAGVEQVCDQVEQEIESQFPGCSFPFRFSPGYGDFSIEHQRDFSRLLDTPRKIGLTVTESCLLAPIKSVTAVIGLSPEKQDCHRKGCEECGKTDCNFRR